MPEKLIGIKGQEFLKSGYVFAPYIPIHIPIHFSRIGMKPRPIFDDPIKKIKHQMGYDVVPDRWEGGESPMLSSSEFISVQPMKLSSTTVFYLDEIVEYKNNAEKK